MADLKNWLAKGLTKDGVTAAKVAAALNMHHSAVYKLAKGERRFRPEELPLIAQVIGEPVPYDPESGASFNNKKVVTIPVEGIVTAGDWIRLDKAAPLAPYNIVVPRDEHFPKAQHLAYRVSGSSLKECGVLDGDNVFAIAFDGMGGYEALNEGMIAVVERCSRRNIVERSLRAVTKTKDSFVLQSGKTETILLLAPTSKPSIASGIRIVSIVRGSFRNFT
jgi:transcriptional regulator with XRE-family HTH domain